MILIEPDPVSDTCMEPGAADCAMLLDADIHYVATDHKLWALLMHDCLAESATMNVTKQN